MGPFVSFGEKHLPSNGNGLVGDFGVILPLLLPERVGGFVYTTNDLGGIR